MPREGPSRLLRSILHRIWPWKQQGRKDTGDGDHQAGTDASSVVRVTPTKSTAGSSLTEQRASFKYRPLELPTAIRIVVLRRGSGNDPIECRLLHIDRGEIPYEALSYEWGLPSNYDPFISVDGCHVRVRTNLRDALMQIRLKEKNRYIWIDALSIDQVNTEERNHQVQMMGNIYKGAEQVIVWLGPAKDDSDFVMDMFADTRSLARGLDGFQKTQFKAFTALCQRSYWRRVWVVQEMFLAQRWIVHCGSKSISDTNLDESLATIARSSNRHSKKSVMSLAHTHIIWKHRLGENFHTLHQWLRLCVNAQFESTEPRDFIYALLGVANDCRNGQLLPDYKKPLLEVYLETVALCNRGGEVGADFARRLAEKVGLTFDENVQRLISEFNTGTAGRGLDLMAP
ncbi:HET-domain-containing protein [Periconia macrospinosa]|uniref:HET-domain-containing protein n=1 Tax=Periconia macrospinosa TaxID=97972 RepID=A0A2V1D1M1_9PLEO|nr:HET-domain-containing protein [Periconia macrospinosa]